MGVSGRVSVMSLADILQWASLNRKTGTLELECFKKCRRIAFSDGRIVGCSANDPSTLLGQFMLAKGKISMQQLRDALARQEVTRQPLGVILVEDGAVTDAEINRAISEKAEEIIYGLFEWDDAVFRFEPDESLESHAIEVNLTVEEIMINGMQRRDELRRIRADFNDSGIVLELTEQHVPPPVEFTSMASRILESLALEPTLAELLLHSHTSEFLLLRFLHDLYDRGELRIKEVREVESGFPTLLDDPSVEASDEMPRMATPADDLEHLDTPAPVLRGASVAELSVDLRAEIAVAERLLSRGEQDAALEVLNACYRAQPGDAHLRHLITKAETEYRNKACTADLAAHRVPVLRQPPGDAKRAGLTPEAAFLVSMIDGQTDIKSILWLAPMREFETLRTLQRMLDRGVIELRDVGEPAGVTMTWGVEGAEQEPTG